VKIVAPAALCDQLQKAEENVDAIVEALSKCFAASGDVVTSMMLVAARMSARAGVPKEEFVGAADMLYDVEQARHDGSDEIRILVVHSGQA